MKRNKIVVEEKTNNHFKLGAITPQEISRSFTVLRHDTGSTGSKFIKHRRQQSDSISRNFGKQSNSIFEEEKLAAQGHNFSMHNLRQLLASTIKTNRKDSKILSKKNQ